MTLMDQFGGVPWGRVFACGALAYLLGCFATGYYYVRLRTGRDIREFDSGATGARNVGRNLGRIAFLVTVAGDFGKGFLAVALAGKLGGVEWLPLLALVLVVAGHVWPVQLQFRGGKGVATSLGGVLALNWQLAAGFAAVFAILFVLTRKTTLPGLFAFGVLPLLAHGLAGDPLVTATIATVTGIVLWAHRRNLVEEIPVLAARGAARANPEKSKL